LSFDDLQLRQGQLLACSFTLGLFKRSALLPAEKPVDGRTAAATTPPATAIRMRMANGAKVKTLAV
jgi:hypothetical protein